MALSDAQLTTLGNHIRANTAVNGNLGSLGTIRDWYNGTASPDFWIFRSDVTNMEVKDALDWTEHLTLSAVELEVFRSLTEGGGFNATKVNIRDGLAEIFAGPQQVNTRTALLNLASKQATEYEKVFAVDATGTTAGGDGSGQNSATVPGVDGDGNDILGSVSTSVIDRALEITAV